MSDQSLASIGIKIESTDAATASANLDKLVSSGDAADAVVDKLAATSKDAAAQLANVGTAATQLAQAQGATNTQVKAATISAAQYAQALRLLPVQIHQGFDQLLYGTNPLVVLSTQVPQITESFGGIGNALKALGSIITPTSVGITALVAAVGALGYAWYEAGAEQDAFRKSLITTGDAAGLTVEQLEGIAKQIQGTGVSRGNAVSALTTALGAGITTNLQQVAQLAAQMQQLAGIPIATTVKEFAALGEEPVKASESLQRSLAFLTPTVYDEIAALQKQGDVAQASAIAQGQLAKSLQEQIDLLKGAQGSWSGMGVAIKNALANVGDFLNPGLDQKIKNLQARLDTAKSIAAQFPDDYSAAAIANIQKQLAPLLALQAKIDAFSKTQQENAAATKTAEFTTSLLPQSLSAGLAAAQQPQVLAITAASDAIERALQAELAATQRYDQLLDAEHSAHLISDQAYYDAKRRAIGIDTENRDPRALRRRRSLPGSTEAASEAARDALPAPRVPCAGLAKDSLRRSWPRLLGRAPLSEPRRLLLQEGEFELARGLLDELLDAVQHIADVAGLVLVQGAVVGGMLHERLRLTDRRRGAEEYAGARLE
jgi:phage-related minor tail protein